MTRHPDATCYFCARGEDALNVMRASLRTAATQGVNIDRLQQRLRSLQRTVATHACAR